MSELAQKVIEENKRTRNKTLCPTFLKPLPLLSRDFDFGFQSHEGLDSPGKNEACQSY